VRAPPRLEQRRGELGHRVAARAQGRKAPDRAGSSQQTGFERFEQAGAHQRGFAGARASGYREQAMLREAVDHRVDLRLSAKENVGLVAFERPQTRIG
jgi:hypothetical protein